MIDRLVPRYKTEYVEPMMGGHDFESMVKSEQTPTDSKELWRKIYDDIPEGNIGLGKVLTNAYLNDPKMLSFVLARYKFVAKMLSGMEAVVEIGCGECFGSALVRKEVRSLTCTDVVLGILDIKKCSPVRWDFRHEELPTPVDAMYMVDVIEHIYPQECAGFLRNITKSLADNGVLLVGTPNSAASQHASENSRAGHVNLYSHDSLRSHMKHHFKNVFMFGMNDEVVHTGYGPMCHYLWALCVGPWR